MFHFVIETIRYRSFTNEELVLSLTSLPLPLPPSSLAPYGLIPHTLSLTPSSLTSPLSPLLPYPSSLLPHPSPLPPIFSYFLPHHTSFTPPPSHILPHPSSLMPHPLLPHPATGGQGYLDGAGHLGLLTWLGLDLSVSLLGLETQAIWRSIREKSPVLSKKCGIA